MAWAQKWTFPFPKLPYAFNLECLSDWQLGSRSTCRWKIEQHVEEILERARATDSAVIFAGDIEDEDRPSTRRIRAEIKAERPEVVYRDAEKHVAWLEKDVIPLLRRLHEGTKYGIIGGVAGHHWVQVSEMQNSVQYMFRRLEELTKKPCAYLGEMVSFLDFRFTYRVLGKEHVSTVRQVGLLQHGDGGGQTKSSTITRLDRSSQAFDADFFIRGHDCQLLGTKTDQLYASEGRAKPSAIHSRTRVMLNLGAATMGYEMTKGAPSYIEQGMMRPATIGWGLIKFKIKCATSFESEDRPLKAYLGLEF
jgi:hypothetical protein